MAVQYGNLLCDWHPLWARHKGVYDIAFGFAMARLAQEEPGDPVSNQALVYEASAFATLYQVRVVNGHVDSLWVVWDEVCRSASA